MERCTGARRRERKKEWVMLLQGERVSLGMEVEQRRTGTGTNKEARSVIRF